MYAFNKFGILWQGASSRDAHKLQIKIGLIAYFVYTIQVW